MKSVERKIFMDICFDAMYLRDASLAYRQVLKSSILGNIDHELITVIMLHKPSFMRAHANHSKFKLVYYF